jgi:hypothetical protein
MKLLLPLNPFSLTTDGVINTSLSLNYQSMLITSSRILYYTFVPSSNLLPKIDLCTQLRQIKFPQAYALFLKDLSRLIKPTSSTNLTIDLIWELMPDIDEHQRVINEHQKHSLSTIEQYNAQIMNHLISDIWAEIGKKPFDP